MPGKSDLSEGVNGCVDKGGLVNIRTLIFSEHFQQGPFRKKKPFICSARWISNLLVDGKEVKNKSLNLN